MAFPAWWLNCAWAGKPGRSRRVRSSDPLILGSKRHEGIGLEERVQHVRAATAIGIVVGVQFAIFDIVTDGMMALGLTELAVVLFFAGASGCDQQNAPPRRIGRIIAPARDPGHFRRPDCVGRLVPAIAPQPGRCGGRQRTAPGNTIIARLDAQ